MAESTQSLDWTDFQQEVGRFLGYGSTIGNWSAAQTAAVGSVVQAGIRRVYYPPATPGVDLGYEWQFLRPTTTLTTTADQGEDDLPDDCHRVIGNFHFAADLGYPETVTVPEGSILEERARADNNDFPRMCAFRAKSSTGSTGQRWQVMWYPEPNAAYVLSYSYEAYTGVLSDSFPYPLGGMHMSELYLESCLAVAEQRYNEEVGLHTQLYLQLLVDAVARDKKKGGRLYGRMGHREHYGRHPFRRGWGESPYSLTYKGVQI